MLRLVDLEPRFVRYETRGAREYLVHTSRLDNAQGMVFLCPSCFEKNGGAVGTHAVEVTFASRGAENHQGSHGRDGTPSRWSVSGSSFDDLTLTPSVDLTPGCAWHGFITNGEIR